MLDLVWNGRKFETHQGTVLCSLLGCFCLILILYVPVNNLSVISAQVFLG